MNRLDPTTGPSPFAHRPSSAVISITWIAAAVIGASALVACALADGAESSRNSGISALREQLQSMCSEKEDALFWRKFNDFQLGFGVDLSPVSLALFDIGGGFNLVGADRLDAIPKLEDRQRRLFELPASPSVRVLADGKILETMPNPVPEDVVVLVHSASRLAIFDMRTGLMWSVVLKSK